MEPFGEMNPGVRRIGLLSDERHRPSIEGVQRRQALDELERGQAEADGHEPSRALGRVRPGPRRRSRLPGPGTLRPRVSFLGGMCRHYSSDGACVDTIRPFKARLRVAWDMATLGARTRDWRLRPFITGQDWSCPGGLKRSTQHLVMINSLPGAGNPSRGEAWEV